MMSKSNLQNKAVFKKKSSSTQSSSLMNSELANLSQHISFESSFLAFISILLKYKNQIKITESEFRIPANNRELRDHINFALQYLCQVRFTFYIDKSRNELFFRFKGLTKTISYILSQLSGDI